MAQILTNVMSSSKRLVYSYIIFYTIKTVWFEKTKTQITIKARHLLT